MVDKLNVLIKAKVNEIISLDYYYVALNPKGDQAYATSCTVGYMIDKENIMEPLYWIRGIATALYDDIEEIDGYPVTMNIMVEAKAEDDSIMYLSHVVLTIEKVEDGFIIKSISIDNIDQLASDTADTKILS